MRKGNWTYCEVYFCIASRKQADNSQERTEGIVWLTFVFSPWLSSVGDSGMILFSVFSDFS